MSQVLEVPVKQNKMIELWEIMKSNGDVRNAQINSNKELEEMLTRVAYNAFVVPLKAFAIRALKCALELSYVVCTVTAVTGVIFVLCDIEKGRKLAVGSSIVYVIIKIAECIVREEFGC